MNETRLLELWSAFVAGQPLSAEDKEELRTALDADASLRRKVLGNDELDALLQVLSWDDRDRDDFAQAFGERLAAGRDATRFIEKIKEGIGRRRSTRRASGMPGSPWAFAIVAACALFGLVLLWGAFSAVPTRKDPEAARRERPAPQPPQAAPERDAPVPVEQQARKEAEARLAKLREEEARAEEARRAAQGEELRKKAEEAFAEIHRRKKEEEERLAKLPPPNPENPKPEPKPAPAPPTPPREKRETQTQVAKVELATGPVSRVAPPGRTAVAAGDVLLEGQGLETAGPVSRAVLVYPDGTRLEVGPNTEVRDLRSEGGKQVYQAKGEIRAVVAKQPKDQSMIFKSSHGEVKVLGTTLRIVVDPDPKKGMRLEVEEGKVEFKNLAGKVVLVESGHLAVAATGVELAARRYPSDDMTLWPREGKIVGPTWRMVKDANAMTGSALESVWRPGSTPDVVRLMEEKKSYVEFTFPAEADKDYYVSVRGSCPALEDRKEYDAVAVEAVDGRFNKPCPYLGPYGVNAILFDNYCKFEGYGWINVRSPRGPRPDTTPISVRFSRAGEQTVRLYVSEPPLRIDAIRISTKAGDGGKK